MLLYGEGDVEAYTETRLPINWPERACRLFGLIGWGDASGEWLIYRNGQVVGGARTSDQHRTVQTHYTKPFIIDPADDVEVTVQHGSMGLKRMRANLVVEYF